jgi:hypothetical protein
MQMAKIVSLTARFSGVVAYSDNSVGSFHSGMEGTETDYVLWSIDKADAIENLKQVSWSHAAGIPANATPWWSFVIIALSSFDFMEFEWDTPRPDVQKMISSLTGRCDFIFAFDDNTTATAAVTATGTVDTSGTRSEFVHVEDESIATADNIAVVRQGLYDLFHNVMDEVIITA